MVLPDGALPATHDDHRVVLLERIERADVEDVQAGGGQANERQAGWPGQDRTNQGKGEVRRAVHDLDSEDADGVRFVDAVVNRGLPPS
jgi:hypothetical protein